MVVRKSASRRRSDARRQSLCRKCYALVAVAAIILPPLVWEQITSIASYVLKSPVSNGLRVKPAPRHEAQYERR
jgi:hypothetical protein